MNGTVTISLEDFKKLENAQGNATKIREDFLLASKEVEVFLSFLCRQEAILPYVEQFNKESKTKIIIQDGRAKIKLSSDTADNS